MLTDETPFDFGFDPSLDELVSPSVFEWKGAEYDPQRVAIVRTSDRSNFRRCRRRWNWSSHLRQNLTSIESASPLWFGTGIHFALEDFHGPHKFPTAYEAFKAYAKATYAQSKAGQTQLPPDFADLVELGRGMLDYYTNSWLIARDPLRTFMFKGQPQVEVHGLIEVPFSTPDYDLVLYAVTLDRVIEDEFGQLWIVEYKTAKRIQTLFFQTDPQVTAYCWIAPQLYGRPIAGVIYQQHLKAVPEDPRIIGSGRISTDRRMYTTHRHYRKALLNLYGKDYTTIAPPENIDFLNWLNEQEDETQDRFIRRDRLERNQYQSSAEGEKLLMELEEMLNPDLPLYPNPTRECGHMCSFNHACISVDRSEDWEIELQLGFRQKSDSFDAWRAYLPEEYK